MLGSWSLAEKMLPPRAAAASRARSERQIQNELGGTLPHISEKKKKTLPHIAYGKHYGESHLRLQNTHEIYHLGG